MERWWRREAAKSRRRFQQHEKGRFFLLLLLDGLFFCCCTFWYFIYFSATKSVQNGPEKSHNSLVSCWKPLFAYLHKSLQILEHSRAKGIHLLVCECYAYNTHGWNNKKILWCDMRRINPVKCQTCCSFMTMKFSFIHCSFFQMQWIFTQKYLRW